jgi:hypothetical protein
MGLFDTLEIPAEISLPGLDRDPSTIDWQTKSIGRPAMGTFRITVAGRLLQEECHTEAVPDDEQPYYGTDKWDEPLFRLAGSFRRIHDGWAERQYHGVIRFVASVDEDLLEYQAKFTDGRLVALRDASGDTDSAWIPVETLTETDITDPEGQSRDPHPTRSEAIHTMKQTDASIGYKQAGTSPLADTAHVYDVSLPDDALTETRHEERYLQVIHLPDERECHDACSEEPIARGRVYELAVREPIIIEDREGRPRPVSAIVEREGPYELDTVVQRAVELATSRQLPIHHEIVRLRPDHWSAAAAWVTCPDCESDEITLVTNLDETDLTLICRACDARVTETERKAMFHEWLHCPSCESGDVNVELSAPHGGGWWSCDDCLYDTMPAPIDTGYTSARTGDPSDT